jgi:hypothetical protein
MGIYREMPAVKNFLQDITNPFLLLIFGIVFTALLQSSSAVTTIIIAMASQGLLIGGGGNAVLYGSHYPAVPVYAAEISDCGSCASCDAPGRV